jgi:hypothetical protein
MLRRDYLVKQAEEFGKVLAVILGLKRDGLFPDMLEEIYKASQKYTSLEILYIEKVENAGLIKDLTEDKKLNDEQMKLLGDLLFEKAEYYMHTEGAGVASDNCYRKAYIIYLFVKDHATLNYSLDMHYKLELLAKMGL